MLADFGLARLVDTIATITATTTTFAGSARFMAPELIIPSQEDGKGRDGNGETPRTVRTDVYAFGCFILQVWSITMAMSYPDILQLFTEERPFNHLPLDPMVILAIARTEKPYAQSPGREAFSRGFDEDLWTLANKCWAFDPAERPKMKVVSEQLHKAMYRIQRISECWFSFETDLRADRGHRSNLNYGYHVHVCEYYNQRNVLYNRYGCIDGVETELFCIIIPFPITYVRRTNL